ncbi:MAG: hypothetical protein ACKVOR_01240 [Flavobacteriales bacterium]
MHIALNHIHSALRWVIILLLVATIIDSLVRMYRPFKENEKKLALFTMIAMHTQLIIGLLLYFISPNMQTLLAKDHLMKDTVARFFVVEHLVGMLLAIFLVTYGYRKAKQQAESWAKHKLLFYYYLFAFIIIMLSIPWPFREAGYGLGWF